MICILLSTYNGSDYLPILLNSLVAQDYPNIRIVIRDDGSTDETCDILSTYAEKYDHIEALYGPNVGANKSFYMLLDSIPREARYAAFCDQDDYWESDKVSRALKVISEQQEAEPALYCSRLTIADCDLKVILLSSPPTHGPSFENALVENIATGSTIVINREAVDLLAGHIPDMNQLEMYDWWIYQTISAFGTVMYDDQSRILSRQHSRNVVGLPFGIRRWRSKYNFIRSRNKSKISTQAREFSRIYHDDLSDSNRHLLDEFLTHVQDSKLPRRMKYALQGRVFRQRMTDNLLLKLRIILGKV